MGDTAIHTLGGQIYSACQWFQPIGVTILNAAIIGEVIHFVVGHLAGI